ncbi:MAG: hypothetical protein ACTHXI_05995, partial [Halomonadaceae bacterium]
TGEIMHDLSVPIYVNGKHWGGFRIGYQPEKAPASVPATACREDAPALDVLPEAGRLARV